LKTASRPRSWRKAVALVSRFQLTEIATVLEDYKAWTPYPTFGGLQFDDPALEPDGDCVRAVVRAQLLEGKARCSPEGVTVPARASVPKVKAARAELFGNQPKRDDRTRISLNAQNLTTVVD
jgi:hypothetical protein